MEVCTGKTFLIDRKRRVLIINISIASRKKAWAGGVMNCTVPSRSFMRAL
jgi:hypothetical protein